MKQIILTLDPYEVESLMWLLGGNNAYEGLTKKIMSQIEAQTS